VLFFNDLWKGTVPYMFASKALKLHGVELRFDITTFASFPGTSTKPVGLMDDGMSYISSAGTGGYKERSNNYIWCNPQARSDGREMEYTLKAGRRLRFKNMNATGNPVQSRLRATTHRARDSAFLTEMTQVKQNIKGTGSLSSVLNHRIPQ
jgi:hypothetical protein